MIVAYLLIWGAWAFLGLSAVLALVWASRHGQLDDLQQAARSIFHPTEPEGGMSDYFPGEKRRRDEALSRRGGPR